jgi:UDP-arabinose 4-epimerase
MAKKSKVVLVTGGAGYIGSHTCKALALAGYTPITYDNFVHGHHWAVRWGPLEIGDIADRSKLDAVIEHYKPDAVMHFAAYAYVGESVLDPGKYYRNNVTGSLTLLEAARDHHIDKLIFSSTCATYGLPESAPIYEGHPQRPINPYGASKLMVERLLADFEIAHGIRSISLRYFNAAGADPNGQIGEAHDPETHLIPLILDVAAGLRAEIQIFGADYDTPDGTCIRDYIHVSDLAEAHVLALQALQSGALSTAYNLGNGQGFSVREVIKEVENITGRMIHSRIASRRPGDPARLVGDATLVKKDLDWKPRFSDLTTILETAWWWHLNKNNMVIK